MGAIGIIDMSGLASENGNFVHSVLPLKRALRFQAGTIDTQQAGNEAREHTQASGESTRSSVFTCFRAWWRTARASSASVAGGAAAIAACWWWWWIFLRLLLRCTYKRISRGTNSHVLATRKKQAVFDKADALSNHHERPWIDLNKLLID